MSESPEAHSESSAAHEPSTTPADAAHQEELERLRSRVAELEGTHGPPPGGRPHGSGWRAPVSAVLIVLACVLAPLAVTATWASTQVSDTDAYVQTVAPLAEDPAIQEAVATKVTDEVLTYVDVRGLTTDLLDTLAAQPNVPPRLADALPALVVPITQGVEGFTRDQVDALLASDAFAQAWEQVNRVAHDQVVKLLEGNQGAAVSAQGDTVTLNLGPIVEQVKQRLIDRGFTLAENIPTVDRSFVLVQSDAVTNAQSVYRLLNTLGIWLPLIALALLVGGIAVARDRRRATERGALGVAGSMLVLGVGLALARMYYVDSLPADVLTPTAAGDVFDTLVRFLRTALRATAVLALVVALAAFLAGPSSIAVRTRRWSARGVGSMRGSAEQAGFAPGRVGTWTWAHRRGLRVGVVILGGLVLVFWSRPSAWTVIVVALVMLVLVGVVEFLATPPVPAAARAAVPAPVPAGVGAPGGEAPAPAEAAGPATGATTGAARAPATGEPAGTAGTAGAPGTAQVPPQRTPPATPQQPVGPEGERTDTTP